MEKGTWPRLRPANNRDCDNIAGLVCGILREYDPQHMSSRCDQAYLLELRKALAFSVLRVTAMA